MRKSYYQQLPLAPLGTQAMGELLADLMGRDASLSVLAERIAERASGNPFFAEELVQSLAEVGGLEGSRGAYRLTRAVDELELPATVQAVLSARIDRLAEREKRLLQTASVIGKELSEAVLRRVAELPEADLQAALASLTEAEFLYPKALFPEAEYAFRHPLTQEVAYHSQLGERRRRVHASVARALEEVHAESPDEHAALVAHHWESAGEALEAARWHRRAAEWAGSGPGPGAPPLAKLSRAHGRSLRIGGGRRDPPGLLRRDPRACDWFLDVAEETEKAAFREGGAGRAGGRPRGSGEAPVRLCAAECPSAGDGGEVLSVLTRRSRSPTGRGTAGFAPRCAPPCDASHAGAVWKSCASAARRASISSAGIPTSARVRGLQPAGRTHHQPGAMPRAARDACARASRRSTGDSSWRGSTSTILRLGLRRSCECLVELAATRWRCRGCELRHAREFVEITERRPSTACGAIGYAPGSPCAGGGVGRRPGAGRTSCGAATAFPVLLPANRCRRHRRTSRSATRRARSVAARGGGPERLAELAGCSASRPPRSHAARVLPRTDDPARERDDRGELATARTSSRRRAPGCYRPSLHEERAELARRSGDAPTRDRELREAHRLYTEMGATGHAERLAKELGL